MRFWIDGKSIRFTSMSSPRVIVSRVGIDQIFALRHAVLRPGRPAEAAQFAGDDDPDNVHFAATINGIVVGCSTLHREPRAGEPAWRLRGMAVDERQQGNGIGRQLLRAVVDFARETLHARLLWCNARLIAVPFYEKLGWSIASDEFHIPDVGPHFVMTKRLAE